MPFVDQLPYPSRYNSLRLLGYDYASTRKLCAITLVADERRPLFADMLVAKAILAPLLSDETLVNLHVQAFTLMPDHLHLIAGVRQSTFDLPNLIASFKSFTTHLYWKRSREILTSGEISLPSQSVSKSNLKESGRDYDYDREEGRGWLDRASDAVASWFGDEEAERRRRMDQRREHRGRGPKGYRRSDERIKEDFNDRLSDDYYLDASNVEVAVENTKVTLTGTVNNRNDKRRAEDLAESVSGVTNVENRLRVKQSRYDDYSNTSTDTRTATNSNITPTSGSTTSSAAAGGRTSGT